jgi:hypothetical protein
MKKIFASALIVYALGWSLIGFRPLSVDTGDECSRVSWWQWIGCKAERWGAGQNGGIPR